MLGWLTVGMVAWGALAFGAVYSWAYWPLAAAAVMIGGSGLFRSRVGANYAAPKALLLSIGCVALGMTLQLVPLPRPVLRSLSPATDTLLQEYNLGYAAAATAGGGLERPARHALSLRPDATARSLALLSAFTLLLAGLSRALNGGGLRRLGYRIVALGLLLALVAIVQKVTIKSPEIYGFWTPEQGTGPYGPFVNKHHFAGWMVMVLSLAMGVVLAGVVGGRPDIKPGWRNRLLWLSSRDASLLMLAMFASLVMGLSLVLSLSRSGITAFALAVLLSAWKVARRESTALLRTVGTIYLGFVVVAAISRGGGLDAVARHFEVASWNDVGGRLAVWQDTAQIIKDVPLVGTGLNTFEDAMLEYQTHQSTLHYAQSHNDYLQLAAEGGLLVAIPILIALFLFTREIRLRFHEGADDETTYWIRVGATTGLVAIALQECVEFSLQMPGNAVLFTVLAAVAIHKPPSGQSRRAIDGVNDKASLTLRAVSTTD